MRSDDVLSAGAATAVLGIWWALGVGYAKRIEGPSTGDGHIVTWGVGLEIPVWR